MVMQVISLALHLAHPAPPAVESGSELQTSSGVRYQSRGTLVVCKVLYTSFTWPHQTHKPHLSSLCLTNAVKSPRFCWI